MKPWQLAFVLFSAHLYSTAAFYQGTDVITLTESNFNTKIKSGGVWLVEVSSDQPRAGHVSSAQPRLLNPACALSTAAIS